MRGEHLHEDAGQTTPGPRGPRGRPVTHRRPGLEEVGWRMVDVEGTTQPPRGGHGRSLVAMTDEEVGDFLTRPLTMALATISPVGQPHLAAMWYGFVDGTLGFLTYRGSQKYK